MLLSSNRSVAFALLELVSVLCQLIAARLLTAPDSAKNVVNEGDKAQQRAARNVVAKGDETKRESEGETVKTTFAVSTEVEMTKKVFTKKSEALNQREQQTRTSAEKKREVTITRTYKVRGRKKQIPRTKGQREAKMLRCVFRHRDNPTGEPIGNTCSIS